MHNKLARSWLNVQFGDTSLTLSCCFGNWEVVAALLKAGARTDIVDSVHSSVSFGIFCGKAVTYYFAVV